MGATVRTLAPDLPVIEARFFGANTREEMEQAFAQCLTLGLESDTWLLLADCSDLIHTAAIADLKDLVQALADLGVADRFREALVRPTDVTAAVAVGFWEAAGVNRGLDVRMFRERGDALAWLVAPAAAP